MTVAEDFLLLAYNDTGRSRVDGTKLKAALAGAAILELTLDGALRLAEAGEPNQKKGRLVATGVTPADPRLAELVAVADGRKPKDAVGKVAGFSAWRSRSRDLREALLRDLVDAGQVGESPTKVLGLFPLTLWKPNPAGAQGRIRERVRSAVVEGAEPDDRTAALVSILHAVDLLPKLFPDTDKRAVKRRGKTISEGNWGGAAVRKAVQEVQAVTVAVITTTVATSGGS
ncbi:GOLPH3/VPS74 family protein [Nocardia wallacei]|uniref:GOLPH3/VPS74 family protein n=1 Tax=Nocardia wallacei TaxID=480035 RepID=UPI0024557C64|nr:GPP34 family phosphoprotein [Nocardia wallacei]